MYGGYNALSVAGSCPTESSLHVRRVLACILPKVSVRRIIPPCTEGTHCSRYDAGVENHPSMYGGYTHRVPPRARNHPSMYGGYFCAANQRSGESSLHVRRVLPASACVNHPSMYGGYSTLCQCRSLIIPPCTEGTRCPAGDSESSLHVRRVPAVAKGFHAGWRIIPPCTEGTSFHPP